MPRSQKRQRPKERSPDELQDQQPDEALDEQIVDLPPREALSIVDPGAFGLAIVPPLGRTDGPTPGVSDAANAKPKEPLA